MPSTQVKFTMQLDSGLLEELRTLAKGEERHVQNVVAEAVIRLLEERRQERAQPDVLRAYQESRARFRSLYGKLASS